MVNPICVDWQITSKCSRGCNYCYGPIRIEDLTFDDAQKVVDNLKEIGSKMISLTGGEPLERDNIDKVMQFIVNRGLNLGQFTNCDFYCTHRDAIFRYVKTLSIPIEGSNSSIHDGLRGKGNFSSVIEALTDCYEESKINLQIGTVLTKSNIADLPNVERILIPFEKRILFWKIYEMIDYGNVKDNNLKIEKRFFEENIFPKLGFNFPKDKIIFNTLEKRNRSYFLLAPDGEAFIPILDSKPKTCSLGNILEEPKNVKERWSKIVDVCQYSKPYRCVFRKDL